MSSPAHQLPLSSSVPRDDSRSAAPALQTVASLPRGLSSLAMVHSAVQGDAYLASSLKRVAILANPRSGATSSKELVEHLARELRYRSLEPVVCWHRDELSTCFQQASGADLRCVVAAGGDGTVLEVLNRAPGIPVALLPLGTENLLAYYCGLRRSVYCLAEMIRVGYARYLDLGRINDRFFCLMASAGIEADVIERVHRRRRGHITRFNYALPLIRALEDYRFPSIGVEIQDTGEYLSGTTVGVFNLPQYGLGVPVAETACPNDGLLDLIVFERAGAWNACWYALAIFCRQHLTLPDVHHRLVRRVRLRAEQPVPTQNDGDPAGGLPANIEVVPKGLRVIVAGPLDKVA